MLYFCTMFTSKGGNPLALTHKSPNTHHEQTPMTDPQDYPALLRSTILQDPAFVRATFGGAQRGTTADALPYAKVTVRPILLKDARHWQFAYWDGVQDTTKNYPADQAARQLEAVLALPFRNFTLHTATHETQINLSKKGKPLISTRAKARAQAPDLAHDRAKPHAAADPSAHPYLHAVGILTQEGKVRAEMQRKYAQINAFIQLIAPEFDAVADSRARAQISEPLRVVDLGCGAAYLTFAAYHHLRIARNREVQMVGVDRKAPLLAQLGETVADLGWDTLAFAVGSIADYQPPTAPHVVIALHACDTATDDAIARGIAWGSQAIITAPCCHHNLQAQLSHAATPAALDPILRHGILFERMGDILTDSLRALLLRICGYRTEVVQFVETEHTPRNLMIRATRTTAEPTALDARALAEYRALKALWGVTPHLETLLWPDGLV
jgi:SAM-dependent methyltransferase